MSIAAIAESPRALIERVCAGLRIDFNRAGNHCTVWTRSDDEFDRIADDIAQSGLVNAGRGGHEYWRELGLICSVYVYRLGKLRVRLLSPTRSPNGMFSNLRELERKVTV